MSKSTFRKWLVLIGFGIIFYQLVNYVPDILLRITQFIPVLYPIFWAIAVAYILSVPMRNIENKVFENKFVLQNKEKFKGLKLFYKLKRPLSLLASLMFLFIILYFIFVWVFPEFITAASSFIKELPAIVDRLNDKVLDYLKEKPEFLPYVEEFNKSIETNIAGIKDKINVQTVITTLISSFWVASEIGSLITNFVLTIIIAIYILLAKEMLYKQWLRFAQAFISDNLVNEYIHPFFRLVDSSFANYISGQFLDAVILGLMIMVAMAIFNIPYIILIGVLVIITAMLPMIGAFISGGLGFFILLLSAPLSKALIFLAIVVVCQQIEGNLIYPLIVGKSVKLPAVWVIIALTIGGSLGGFVGILVAIPIFSVIYSLFSILIRKRIFDSINSKRKTFRQGGDALFKKITNNLEWETSESKIYSTKDLDGASCAFDSKNKLIDDLEHTKNKLFQELEEARDYVAKQQKWINETEIKLASLADDEDEKVHDKKLFWQNKIEEFKMKKKKGSESPKEADTLDKG